MILAILTISLLTNCTNSDNKKVNKNDRMELVPEPDKDLKEEYKKKKNSLTDSISIKENSNKDSLQK